MKVDFNFKVDRRLLSDCKSKEEIAIRKQLLSDAEPLLIALQVAIDQIATSELDELCKTSAYESPAWAEKTADTIGFVRALKTVQRLITLKPISKETTNE